MESLLFSDYFLSGTHLYKIVDRNIPGNAIRCQGIEINHKPFWIPLSGVLNGMEFVFLDSFPHVSAQFI